MFSGKIEDYILFEDKEIIVCRKPAGIAVQNARIGAMDLESSLKNYLAMQDGGGRRIPYLAVIHRLDQPVEGILVFGKTPEAAKSLSAQITAGKMEKIYLAVTYGKQAEAGKKEKVLEDYLKKDGKSNTSSVVNAHTPGAKKARSCGCNFRKEKMAASNSSGYRPSSPDPGSDGSCRNAFGW